MNLETEWYLEFENRTMQTAIPYMQFRGGSSKGLFFKASDLPPDKDLRNKMVLAAMEGVGRGDPRQIDGLGGATSVTSKVAIVSKSETPEADLDYLFLQVVIGKGQISTTQTCGNILSAVLPFAIESGMITAANERTTARIKMVNTGGICEVTVETPGGVVNYKGAAKVDGVPGTAAPVFCNYLDTVGSTCGALLPTGNSKDLVDGIELTCIDNGMPEVLIKAADLGITGYESPLELNENTSLKEKLEHIRLLVGPKMNLGEVKEKTIPKMCLVSPPVNGGAMNTRTFIPHVCHEAIGVLGAVSAASAILLKGSITENIAKWNEKDSSLVSIEHPTGELSVRFEVERKNGDITFNKSGVMRTARLLSKGWVYIPEG